MTLCRLCRINPPQVADRALFPDPRKAICLACHVQRLAEDLHAILADWKRQHEEESTL